MKVLNAKKQVVSGVVYYITLEALDGGKKKVYEAKIWEKPWENFTELQEFKLIGEAPFLAHDVSYYRKKKMLILICFFFLKKIIIIFTNSLPKIGRTWRSRGS